MRRIRNTVGALLLLGSYVWGGCVPCPLLAAQASAGPDCCYQGKCDRVAHQSVPESNGSDQAPPTCQQTVWLFDRAPDPNAGAAIGPDAAPAERILEQTPAALPAPSALWIHSADRIAASPPDLLILHGALLI